MDSSFLRRAWPVGKFSTRACKRPRGNPTQPSPVPAKVKTPGKPKRSVCGLSTVSAQCLRLLDSGMPPSISRPRSTTSFGFSAFLSAATAALIRAFLLASSSCGSAFARAAALAASRFFLPLAPPRLRDGFIFSGSLNQDSLSQTRRSDPFQTRLPGFCSRFPFACATTCYSRPACVYCGMHSDLHRRPKGRFRHISPSPLNGVSQLR